MKSQKFKYRGYVFDISIQTNVQTIGGELGVIQHEMRINDTGVSNFYHKELISDGDLEEAVKRFKQEARNFVDEKKNRTPLDVRLRELGFK